jgi:hypothetical protein
MSLSIAVVNARKLTSPVTDIFRGIIFFVRISTLFVAGMICKEVDIDQRDNISYPVGGSTA